MCGAKLKFFTLKFFKMSHICMHNEQAECRQIITTCEMNHKAQKKLALSKLTGRLINKGHKNFNVNTSPTVKTQKEELYSNIPHRYFSQSRKL